MGMYIGGGNFIHAPHTGDVVKISAAFRAVLRRDLGGCAQGDMTVTRADGPPGLEGDMIRRLVDIYLVAFFLVALASYSALPLQGQCRHKGCWLRSCRVC